MRIARLACLTLLVVGLAACGPAGGGPADAIGTDAAPDVDAPPLDIPAGEDVSGPQEGAVGEEGAVADETAVTEEAAGPEESVLAEPADVPTEGDAVEASEPFDAETEVPAQTVFAAVAGQRCTPATRIGEVVVQGQPGGTASIDASAAIADRRNSWAPGAELSDAACTFFVQAPPAYCESCPADTLCAPDATCQAMPVPATDLVLVLSAGSASQTFVASGTNGAYGIVTLPGRTFSLEVSWSGLTVTLGDTTVPDELEGLSGTESGPWNAPTSLDLAWTPPAAGTSVFTHIPINHHAGGPTYTECLVPASAGSLHVDGAMLAPLAVVTGLEFQGIDHARFAAAQTPLGCVELSFRVQQYASLTGL